MRLTLSAFALLALTVPALAQDAPASAPRQPSGALVPDPAATPNTANPDAIRAGDTAPGWDPGSTGTIRSRDTKGLPQSPENLNVFGCKQIDPLCQGEPRR